MLESVRDLLSKNLLELRTEKGLSQAELAQKAGFQYNSYNRWENGRSWPDPDTISAIARALEVPPSRLFLDTSLISPKVAVKVLNDLVDTLSV